MTIVECIKSVKIGDTILYRKGELVDLDNESRKPIDGSLIQINFTNLEYFRKYNKKFQVGSYVIYNDGGNTYFCRITAFNFANKSYAIEQVSGSLRKDVSQNRLSLADIYYFINTEGMICVTYIGKNKMRDNWCWISGNRFSTREEAQNKVDEIRHRY